MTPANLASLAQSLRDNEAFQAALDLQRHNALERLAGAEPTDTNFIRDQQSMVRVIDNIKSDLEQFIRSGAPRNPPGIA